MTGRNPETSPHTLESVAVDFVVSADSFRIIIDDGRELSAALACFPLLLHAFQPWLARTLGLGRDFQEFQAGPGL